MAKVKVYLYFLKNEPSNVYAYTTDKGMSKRFEDERDMNLFVKKKVRMDKYECMAFQSKNNFAKLQQDVLNDGKDDFPILMTIFSVCGTTYGMLEETVGFYVLLAATMFAAGMDPLVGAAVILLGAGSGVLGSTINPFATGVALSAIPEGIATNRGIVMILAIVLWLTTYVISAIFVTLYAK